VQFIATLIGRCTSGHAIGLHSKNGATPEGAWTGRVQLVELTLGDLAVRHCTRDLNLEALEVTNYVSM
jgi:hypothetical protein